MKTRLLTPLTILTLVFAAGVTAQDTDTTTQDMFAQFEPGERITLSGAANIVSPNAFVLNQTMVSGMADSGEDVLVFPGSGSNFDIDVNNGLPVQATGQFDMAEVENRLDLTLDENAFTEYDNNDWALIATSVQPLVDNNLATDSITTGPGYDGLF